MSVVKLSVNNVRSFYKHYRDKWSRNELVQTDSWSPSSFRKVVPKAIDSHPNSAWDINEVEKGALYESQSDSNLLEEETRSTSEHELNTKCKYIEIKDENLKHYRISYTSLPNDEASVVTTVKTEKLNKRQKRKSSFRKFLCPPYFILLASIIEISMYAWGDEEVKTLLKYSPHQRYQVWRFATYMLLHSDMIHLSLNIIIQTLLATLIELEQNWWRCALVYIGGGIFGALGASVLQPTLYMVGASAGVYALLTSHAANVIVRYSTVSYKLCRIFVVAFLTCSDVAFSIIHSYSLYHGFPMIGWAAHCAGAFGGIIFGLIIYAGEDRQNKYVKIAIWISVCLLLGSVVTAILYNIFLFKI